MRSRAVLSAAQSAGSALGRRCFWRIIRCSSASSATPEWPAEGRQCCNTGFTMGSTQPHKWPVQCMNPESPLAPGQDDANNKGSMPRYSRTCKLVISSQATMSRCLASDMRDKLASRRGSEAVQKRWIVISLARAIFPLASLCHRNQT